jgi:hypothetical protein
MKNTHFIGIGAHKAGSTWLHENLRKHPDVWLPPKKELHYFDRSPYYSSPSHLSSSRNLFRHLFSSKKESKSYKKELLHSLYFFSKSPCLGDLKWYLNYHFGPHDDEWYLSLFNRRHEPVTGEITPAYSMLEAEDVEKVHRLLPDARVIFLLREPIDRAWSGLRYRQKRNPKQPKLSDLSVEEVRQIINSPAFDQRANYPRTLQLWNQKFPREQLFIGFYDEILADPVNLLLRLFDFLGVESSAKHIAPDVKRKVNASPKMDIPADVSLVLAEKFYPQAKELSATLGGVTQDWLRKLEAILEKASFKEASPAQMSRPSLDIARPLLAEEMS